MTALQWIALIVYIFTIPIGWWLNFRVLVSEDLYVRAEDFIAYIVLSLLIAMFGPLCLLGHGIRTTFRRWKGRGDDAIDAYARRIAKLPERRY